MCVVVCFVYVVLCLFFAWFLSSSVILYVSVMLLSFAPVSNVILHYCISYNIAWFYFMLLWCLLSMWYDYSWCRFMLLVYIMLFDVCLVCLVLLYAISLVSSIVELLLLFVLILFFLLLIIIIIIILIIIIIIIVIIVVVRGKRRNSKSSSNDISISHINNSIRVNSIDQRFSTKLMII